MGISGGPYIVRDSSLVLELDAADLNSYPGSGTTWYDLVQPTTYSGSLVNGPTFNSTNGGNIVFDGSNDFVTMSFSPVNLATNNFTIEVWCRPTSTIANVTEATSGFGALSGQRYVVEPYFQDTNGGAGLSVGTNGIVVAEHGADYIPALLEYTATISNTVFSHIVITYTNKQPRAYLNGVLVRTGLTSVKTTVYLALANIGGMSYGYFAGGLATTRYYNRTLSIDEIAQNYNEQKSRFNL